VKPRAHTGRLSFRVEGGEWACYWVPDQDIVGGVRFAQIRMSLVQNKDRKEAFMQLMRDCFSDFCRHHFGSEPTWGEPVAAPKTQKEPRRPR
jgi:hypothetical protein